MDIGYLYVHDKPLKLSLQRYTLYLSFKFGLGATALLFLLPLASTRFPDTILAGTGLVSKIAGLLLLGFAWNEGSVFGSKDSSFINIFTLVDEWSYIPYLLDIFCTLTLFGWQIGRFSPYFIPFLECGYSAIRKNSYVIWQNNRKYGTPR